MLRMFWSTAAQVVFVLAFVLLVAFAGSVALTLTKFSEAMSRAVGARYDIHATDIRTNIETGINLGLDVTEIAGNVDVVVRNRLALDDGIVRIIVTAADGSEVISAARQDTGAHGLSLAERSLPIQNSYGGTEGRVTVVYETGANSTVVWDAARTLSQDVVIITAIAAVLAGLACLVVMVPLMRSVVRAKTILAQPAASDPQATGAATAGSTDIEDAARRAVRASQTAIEELDRVQANLRGARAEGQE